jgi:drug/metabolite transporter (DMT)-like permease
VLAVLLALGASATWGLADFYGPLKGRRLGALRTLLYVQVAGLTAIALIVAARARGPAHPAAFFAVPAAISGTLGLYSYYRGMAVGAMSVVAPIAGASAAIPVVFGIATGDRPSVVTGFGIAASLIGVVLASRERRPGGSRVAAGVGLALLAAIGFGCYFPPMHAAGRADFWWAALLFRITSTSVIVVAALLRRPPLRIDRADALFLALVGVGDMTGNLLFAAASSRGLVSVTSVLASLYPIVTVALARTVLQERVARTQQAGVVLTLAGVALISAGY